MVQCKQVRSTTQIWKTRLFIVIIKYTTNSFYGWILCFKGTRQEVQTGKMRNSATKYPAKFLATSIAKCQTSETMKVRGEVYPRLLYILPSLPINPYRWTLAIFQVQHKAGWVSYGKVRRVTRQTPSSISSSQHLTLFFPMLWKMSTQ